MSHQGFATVVLAALAIVVAACTPATPPAEEEASMERSLQQLVESVVEENPSVHGAALHVIIGDFSWEGAAGLADPDSGETMRADHPVRIASNTKTFVAATVLRLVEDGRLGVDDPISRLLSPEHQAILHGDGYDLDAMTVRHLLNHSSGLFDHSDSEHYEEMIIANPHHRWTPREQIQAAVDWGQPWAAPGRVYHYADTGYILLGEIVENTTGQSLPRAMRELLDFAGLGLDATWFETLEEPPPGVPGRAHQFLGELDTSGFDPSFDLYGGGGLVSTMGDLARFTSALFSGRVFRNAHTLDLMLSTSEGLRAAPDADAGQLPPGAYRMGIWQTEVDGLQGYSHSGFWGTIATWIPELELSVAATVNQHLAKPSLLELNQEAVASVHAAVAPR